MSKVVKRPYSSPLRAGQARLTREAIVDAAARLFSEKGYAAVSLDDIAEAAGVRWRRHWWMSDRVRASLDSP